MKGNLADEIDLPIKNVNDYLTVEESFLNCSIIITSWISIPA